MRTFIYVIWGLIPLLLFSLALYAKLEQWGKSGKNQNPGDFFKQGLFVTLCVGIAVAIDQYLLETLVRDWLPISIPIGFFQMILLPVVLLVAAKFLGGSKEISITKAPHPSERRRRR